MLVRFLDILLELTAAGNNGFQYACLPGMPMGETFLLSVRVLLPLVAVPRQWHVLQSCVQQYFGIARLVMYHPAFSHDLQHGSIIAVTAQFILGSYNSFTRIVGVSHRWALDILTYRTLIICFANAGNGNPGPRLSGSPAHCFEASHFSDRDCFTNLLHGATQLPVA